MDKQHGPQVLIIGAGSMGILIGYHLSLAGADISFLIRPHRAPALDHPQVLYSYDDNHLKEYRDYTYITDPTEIVGKTLDYIVITLNGASLRSTVGQQLVKTIGQAAQGTNTKIILGSVFIDLRPWFLRLSGLADEQVTNGCLHAHAYPTASVTLPEHEGVQPELIAKADIAYTESLGQGLCLDDSSPAVANSFALIYNSCGCSRCIIQPAAEFALAGPPLFAVFAACDLLNWPTFKDIDINGEVWVLAVAAMREIQSLRVHGEAGQQAASVTTASGLVASMAAWEKQMLPLDLAAFNRYQHGEKVVEQDRELLATCISLGEEEGKPMSALKELVRRLQTRHGQKLPKP